MGLPFLILLLLVNARFAGAQPSPPSNDQYSGNFNAATAILIVLVVSGFFFLAFFSVYFSRCSFRSPSAVVPAVAVGLDAGGAASGPRGLDPAVIETFPVLSYSAAAGLKVGKQALECAVCLSEFAGEETLIRMLPKCCHVFHPDCIDTWLACHVTCPVCRADLSSVEGGPCGDEKNDCGESRDDEEAAEEEVAADLGRMERCHSTGDVTGGHDRFTLRLPENVRKDIVAAGRGSLRRSASMAVFGGGEGSSRRGYRRGGLSERWTSGILGRVSTWRRGDGEGSAAKKAPEGREGSFRGGMLNCLIGSASGRVHGDDDDEARPTTDLECGRQPSSSASVVDRV